RLLRFGQSVVSPVQHVIVRQSACADMRGRETTNVLGVHPIMNPFAGPWRFSQRNGGLQVWDSKIDFGPFQFLQRIAPDVIERERARYRSVGFLRKMDILARIAHIGFVQNRINGMRQRLINSSPRHYVATEKQAHWRNVSRKFQAPKKRASVLVLAMRKRCEDSPHSNSTSCEMA